MKRKTKTAIFFTASLSPLAVWFTFPEQIINERILVSVSAILLYLWIFDTIKITDSKAGIAALIIASVANGMLIYDFGELWTIAIFALYSISSYLTVIHTFIRFEN